MSSFEAGVLVVVVIVVVVVVSITTKLKEVAMLDATGESAAVALAAAVEAVAAILVLLACKYCISFKAALFTIHYDSTSPETRSCASYWLGPLLTISFGLYTLSTTT